VKTELAHEHKRTGFLSSRSRADLSSEQKQSKRILTCTLVVSLTNAINFNSGNVNL